MSISFQSIGGDAYRVGEARVNPTTGLYIVPSPSKPTSSGTKGQSAATPAKPAKAK